MAQYLLQKAIILQTLGVQVTPKPDSPQPQTPESWHTLYWTPESWNMALGGLVLESLILYLKGMRILMFQLSGFYYKGPCTQIVYTLGPMYPYREYFKANVCTIWVHGP